jgi:AraC-like DNA-binding protein
MIKLTLPFMGDREYHLNDILREQSRFNYAAEWGSVKVITVTIADIRLFVIEFNSNDKCPVTVEFNIASLMLSFTLSGQYQLENQEYCTECTHYGLVSTGNLKLPLLLKGSLRIFTVCFLRDSLKQSIIDDLYRDQNVPLQSIRPTTSPMNQVIATIIDNMGKGGRQHIYAEAKTLELLCLELEQLESLAGQQRNPLWKEQDHDRINKAKTIIEENLLNPCSLIELAHKVGLNDFKLKKGFREVLGTTVFGYLYDLRMNKATVLLKEGKLVRDVAYEVGYKNAHHFTVAFKKKFGYLPSRVGRLLGMCFFCVSFF